MKKDLRIAISLIFKKDNKILTVKRSDNKESFPGFWSLPSMYTKEGESSQDVAERIVKNKLGLANVFIGDKPLGVSTTIDRGSYLLEMKDFIVQSYQGEINLNKDVYTEYKWVTPEELLELIKKDNNGEMGECTRVFLLSEGLIQ